MDDLHVDEAKVQRIQQLEVLLRDYKTTNDELVKEMEELGINPGDGPMNQAISEQLETERNEKIALQQGGQYMSSILV